MQQRDAAAAQWASAQHGAAAQLHRLQQHHQQHHQIMSSYAGSAALGVFVDPLVQQLSFKVRRLTRCGALQATHAAMLLLTCPLPLWFVLDCSAVNCC